MKLNALNIILSTHSSSSTFISYLLPIIGIIIAEFLSFISFDVLISFDDLSKHSKSYRQIKLILGSVPSRDAFPSDIFNIHSSLLERCGILNNSYRGSISSFPVIETINSDITEFIATNVISITDGQLYINKELFNLGIRPSIDSALSVSRIGSNAQCKIMKTLSLGIKNELTLLRFSMKVDSSTHNRLLLLYNVIFIQDAYFISSFESTIMALFLIRNNKNMLSEKIRYSN